MFPQTPAGELEEALRSNLTIDFAIDELLSRSNQDVSLSSKYQWRSWQITKHRSFFSCYKSTRIV